MEHRFNAVNSVDSSLKESSHAKQLRIRRRQSVHDVLNDKSLLDSVLNQDNRQQVRRDTSTVYGQKLEREAKDPVVAAAMGTYLQKQSLRSLTMVDLEANLEIKKIETALKSIPTHQQPHFHATQGSLQLHLSRIKETQRSKPKNSWLTHTSNCHRFGNTVWNRQLHKSEYTKSHVKHPKPKQLRQQLKKRRNLDFNRILNKKLGSGVDSDDINHYKQVVQSTRMTRGY